MSIEFKLPDVGEGLVEGEIVRWLVAEGSTVSIDQEFVEIETDKAVVSITAPVSGTLVRHGASEGDLLPVGETLAVFSTSDDDVQDAVVATATATATPTAPVPARADADTAPTPVTTELPGGAAQASGSGRPRATPATRKYARERGVSLATIAGSGPGGRIVPADIDAHLAGPAVANDSSASTPNRPPVVRRPVSREDQVVPMRGIRRAVSRTMTASWATVPHVNAFNEVDMSELKRLRSQLAAEGVKIPLTAFLVRAAALALREYPALNTSVDAEAQEIHYHGHINIGVAIDSPDGLTVPVIHDADALSVGEIGRVLEDLVASAADRSLSTEALSGGTFTVNNYGPLGGWFGTSLVKPPEVGILSLGRARDTVVTRDGDITVRPIATIALAADHRVADGRELIGFGTSIQRRLELPALLLAEV